MNTILPRRALLHAAAATAAFAQAQPPRLTYANNIKGIRIVPGQWRPEYPWEHIAWISPPWPTHDYIWLDLPEAIFTSQGLLFLSHLNPAVDFVYNELPSVAWQRTAHGITVERTLPNGVRFRAGVDRQGETAVALSLSLHNGTSQPLRNISLQTCAFLRAIREFADYTRANKYVHLPKSGWTAFSNPMPRDESGPYRVGWRRSGVPVADWPVMVTVSNQAQRLAAMTWHADTLSMVSNPDHPCFHADPRFKDLEPGESAAIRGHLIFFEGSLEDFDFPKAAAALTGKA